MDDAPSTSQLRRIYDAAAHRYDLQHALLTLHSDQRGRRMVVELGVQERDRVLDPAHRRAAVAILCVRSAQAGLSGTVERKTGPLRAEQRKSQENGCQSHSPANVLSCNPLLRLALNIAQDDDGALFDAEPQLVIALRWKEKSRVFTKGRFF